LNKPWFVFLLWGLELAVLCVLGLFVFVFRGPESPLLLGGSALTFFLLSAFIAARGLGQPYRGPEAIPDVSPPTALLGVAVVLLAVSADLGPWLTLIAAGLIGLALGGLARERGAQRALAHRTLGDRSER
jgi:hypothetical protein